jgi:hypothetical protein
MKPMTVISASKLQNVVDKAILGTLSPNGFVAEESGGAFCDRGGVYLYVAGLTQHLHGKNQIRPFGQVGFDAVNRIKAHFMRPAAGIAKATGTFQAHFRHFVGERDAFIGCETLEELPEALKRVADFVSYQLLPCIEKYSDPALVLQVYVGHDETKKNSLDLIGAHDYNSALSGLILARIYGPDAVYRSLKERYQMFFNPLLPAIKGKVSGLIAYLDRDPLPDLQS